MKHLSLYKVWNPHEGPWHCNWPLPALRQLITSLRETRMPTSMDT